jgi:hypothetical protein
MHLFTTLLGYTAIFMMGYLTHLLYTDHEEEEQIGEKMEQGDFGLYNKQDASQALEQQGFGGTSK